MIEIVAAYDDDDEQEEMYDYISPSLLQASLSQASPQVQVLPQIQALPPSEPQVVQVVYEPPQQQQQQKTQTAETQAADKDAMLQHLMDLIEAKQSYIARKQKELRETSKQNEFLQTVRQDYGKYNQFILRQKHDQLAAFQLLQQHLDQLAQTGELSEQNAKDAKAEQQKILQEIDDIKSGLQELMSDYDSKQQLR